MKTIKYKFKMVKSSKLLSFIFLFSLLLGVYEISSCKKKEVVPSTPPIPVLPSCNDGIKNQDVVEIDCGGTCNPCTIKYPNPGNFGINLLYGTDTLRTDGTGNSLSATVPVGSSFKVEFNLISGPGWLIEAGNSFGWVISNYSNGQQTFKIQNPGTADVTIIKSPFGGASTILLKYFENSTSETRRKIIVLG